MTQVYGLDPGLVDTGLVRLVFDRTNKHLTVTGTVITGATAEDVAALLDGGLVFVEKYRPRQRLNTDTRMVQLEQDLRRAIPHAQFHQNMGIKRVITQDLMELLDVWHWKQTTHHQDLRSAARIALLGMTKEWETNSLLAAIVEAHISGRPWSIEKV
jgi:hypothetical protein